VSDPTTHYVLLEVADVFALSGIGIVVLPDFDVCDLGPKRSWLATLVRPDGEALSCGVSLDVTHFNIRDSVDVNRRWRLVPRITGLTKDQIAVGSHVLIEDADGARVLGLKLTNA
jgi:hypothetical protein